MTLYVREDAGLKEKHEYIFQTSGFLYFYLKLCIKYLNQGIIIFKVPLKIRIIKLLFIQDIM